MPGARRSLCVFNDNVVTYIPSFCVHNRIVIGIFLEREGVLLRQWNSSTYLYMNDERRHNSKTSMYA